MKFISLRVCAHDSNISYYDGNNVYYYKSERDYQEKHHGFRNLWEWRDVVKRVWDLDYREIDEIALIFEPITHNIKEEKHFFPYIKYDLFPAPCPVYRLDHHYAHSLSAWMIEEKNPDVYVIIDGAGDAGTDIPWTIIKDGRIVDRGSLRESDSIGRLMVDAGDVLGLYKVSDHIDWEKGLDVAGKVMSLQSYGSLDIDFIKELRKYNIREVNKIFDYKNWINYKKDDIIANHTKLDWIKSVHYRVGELLVSFFKKYCSKNDVIHYSGGVAQNIVWNTLLKKEFPNIVIPPHSNDEGLSLGGIEFLRRKNKLNKFKLDNFPYIQSDVASKKPHKETIEKTVEFLKQGKIVAWYQGNGEVGPRALGNRSILMDPRIPDAKNIINKIKKRENFRPFGASVLEEDKERYFENELDDEFMLYTCNVKDKILKEITHIDGTCRVQIVKNRNPIYRKLLEEFKRKTGHSVLLNTSLNINGKPIAGNPYDAGRLFEESLIDILVIGNQIFKK